MFKLKSKMEAVSNASKAAFLSIIAIIFLCAPSMEGKTGQIENEKKFICVKDEKGSPISAIAAYDSDRMAIVGDERGDLYRIDLTTNDPKHTKLNSVSYNPIEAIITTCSIGNFFFLTDGRVYLFKNKNITDITENISKKIKDIYFDKESSLLFSVTTDNEVYFLSEKDIRFLKWVPVKDFKTKKNIIANIEKEKKDNLRLLKSADNKSIQSDWDLNIASCNGNLLGTNDGKIYAKNPYAVNTPNYTEESKLTISVVSPALGIKDKVIYRVSITGKKLNTEEIFTKGYNGFKYELSDERGENKSYAYPITGMVYTSNGGDNANLQPREISFLWLGPKVTAAENRTLLVKELCFDFSSTTSDQVIDIAKIPLPELPKNIPDYSNYEIIIKSNDKEKTVSNGTCAYPIDVVIKKTNETKPELPSEDVYNHLVFYSQDSGANPKKLLGCDPTEEGDYFAVIPAFPAKIEGQYIRYGMLGQSDDGRKYYLYTKSEKTCVFYAAIINNNHELGPSQTLPISPLKNEIAVSTPSKCNTVGGRDFTFPNLITASNWQGNNEGNGGYLDYQLDNYEYDKGKFYKGVFVYLPEGLNTRAFKQRKDLRTSQLVIGYYFDPIVKEGNPFAASQYHINDTPSFCAEMRGKTLYAKLFDSFGRCTEYSEADPDNTSVCDYKFGGGKNLWKLREAKDWGSMPMQIRVGNLYKTPIIMGAENNSLAKGFGVTKRGLFVPSINEGENATFVTNIRRRFDKNVNEGQYIIRGYRFNVPENYDHCIVNHPKSGTEVEGLFENMLDLQLSGFVDAWIALSVSGEETKEKVGKNYGCLSKVRSLNGTLLDWAGIDWDVYHIPASDAFPYAWNFNMHRMKSFPTKPDTSAAVFVPFPANRYYYSEVEGGDMKDLLGITSFWRLLWTKDWKFENTIYPFEGTFPRSIPETDFRPIKRGMSK